MTESPSPFAEPWEAQVFALVVSLQEAGLFSAAEWAQTLGAAIRPEGGGSANADYAHWLLALERLLAERGIAPADRLTPRSDAFLRAAAATPHGQPVVLANDPLREG